MIASLKSFLQLTEQELKEPIVLKLKDNTYYMLFNTKANVFTTQWMRMINKKIDIVEKHQGPTALVVASLSKIFSGGLDLNFLAKNEDEDIRYFSQQCHHALGRLVSLPFPTICLVHGPAIAAGCMFALSFDKVYVGGKALFCANQAANQITIQPSPMSILKARHANPSALRDMVIISKKFNEKQALENSFIDGIWSQEIAVRSVHEKAQEMADFGYNKNSMKKIKFELYKDAIKDSFTNFTPYSEVGYNPFSKRPKL